MQKIYFLLFLLVFTLFGLTQENDFTPVQKAYLFHIVKKSPILDTNMGQFIQYKGKIIRYGTKEWNFDSIESIIVAHPDLLVIQKEELAKCPKGILAEASNKMALWELNLTMDWKRKGSKEDAIMSGNYQFFQSILLPLLPSSAVIEKNGEQELHPKLEQLLNPNLSFSDKKELITTIHFLNLEDQLVCMRGIGKAINQYVEKRTIDFYQLLGGTTSYFSNAIIAAGDGTPNGGNQTDREKDEKSKWNRGMPKAVGFFPYLLEIKKDEKAKKPALDPYRFATLDFNTAGNNKSTIIHCDVWAYPDKKQTTVVIEKNGLSYHLFGNMDNRFLAPDSLFEGGKTFYAAINDLEKNHIAKLDEQIHGKKGFDYQIDYFTKKRDETELMIEKAEKNYSDMGYTPISTKKNASRKVKKARKKNQKKGGGPLDVQPTTDSGKKKRGKKQQNIIDLYNEYEFYKRKIEETKILRQEAIDARAKYQRRLDLYMQQIGYKWASYTEKDGLYTFEDSSTFDLYTQEFTFPPQKDTIPFEVRLLSIPENGISDQTDEVMLHVSVIDAKPNYDARIQVHLEDVFEQNSWNIKEPLFSEKDSASLRLFFSAIKEKKIDTELYMNANGMGVWNGTQVTKNRDTTKVELNQYPGNSEKEQIEAAASFPFKQLRYSSISIQLNRGIFVYIDAFTDPVKSKFKTNKDELLDLKSNYGLTDNEILCVYRVNFLRQKLLNELIEYSKKFIKVEEQKQIQAKLEDLLSKGKITVGKTRIDSEELED